MVDKRKNNWREVEKKSCNKAADWEWEGVFIGLVEINYQVQK
jgi:hypothetical protein